MGGKKWMTRQQKIFSTNHFLPKAAAQHEFRQEYW